MSTFNSCDTVLQLYEPGTEISTTTINNSIVITMVRGEDTQRVNIRIKFYDLDESCIGEAQSGENTVIDEDADALVVRPNEILSASFNFYDEDLDEGRFIRDVAYISIEDIIFS